MTDLSNLLKINGKDAWTTWNAFLGEQNGESKNMNSLMRIPAVKEVTKVDFHERNGVELPPNPQLTFKAIERPLKFWILETTKTALLAKYGAFMREVSKGKISLDITGWRQCTLVYQDMANQPEIYEEPGRMSAVVFTIKFLEPNPII